MFHVILFQPEIPQNTGNVGRLCAYTGCVLHLIHPLGFRISDRHLRRSGMDYWYALDLREHRDWDAFLASDQRPARIHLLTTKGARTIWETHFADGDGLLFGNEGHGVPDHVHTWAGDNRLTIPRFTDGLRSLNLATSVGITVYEGLRQLHAG